MKYIIISNYIVITNNFVFQAALLKWVLPMTAVMTMTVLNGKKIVNILMNNI